MAPLLILSCIILIFYILNLKRLRRNKVSVKGGNPTKDEIAKERDFVKPLYSVNHEEQTAIDNTSILEASEPGYNLIVLEDGVPFWKDKEICSLRDINQCSNQQLTFYKFFKSCFIQKEYLDLEGNTNYAFILLFDFLLEFSIDEDIDLLEEKLAILGIYYPETNENAQAFLIAKKALVAHKSIIQNRILQDVEEDEDIPVEFPTKLDMAILDTTEDSFNLNNKEEHQNLKFPQTSNDAGSKDTSIEDITGESSYQLKASDLGYKLTNYPNGIPAWEHRYVYSGSEIENATIIQREFYKYFKACFLKEEYLDLEGNTNYAFILLFDLLEDYEVHKDIMLLEKQYSALSLCYPSTKSYARSFLRYKTRRIDYDGANYHSQQSEYQHLYESDYVEWRLGNKYKAKLNLSDAQTELLNNFYYSTNNFSRIEYCNIEIIKLFLQTTAQLENSFKEENTSLNEQLTFLADIIARKHFKYRANSYNYKYCLESTTKDVLTQIYKYCENAIREHYGHKRKLSIEVYYVHKEILLALDNVITKAKNIITSLLLDVNIPDEDTEVELYAQNSNRWKLKFHEITTAFQEKNGNKFIEDVKQLAHLNRRNPSVENIFYEASKFTALVDKQASLTLYIYYLHQDLKSTSFDNKKLTKTIQKSLFKTDEQLKDFEIIIREFINDRNIEKALESVNKIYIPKRKKIKLDSELIDVVNLKHSGTVELLNLYLSDEDEQTVMVSEDLKKEELHFIITPKGETHTHPTSIDSVLLNSHQTEILNLFKKGSFILSQSEIDAFVRERGLFKNQFIESINEACFEALDDILIEEEEENYIINDNYYKKIFEND